MVPGRRSPHTKLSLKESSVQDVDWLSDIYLKPLPGKTAPETLQAIDKMIVTCRH